MYPHERSLVQKLRKEPFALIGVNSDQDRVGLKQVLKAEQITWRSFWDGGSTQGPIATAWQVRGWPTIYVLDHKGVIRHKNLRGEPLEAAVMELVKAAKQDAAAETAQKPPTKPAGGAAEAGTKPALDPSDPERLEKAAASKLSFAKQLAEEGRTEKARERYQEVIKLFPKTKAAREAKQLLDKLSQ